MDLGRPYVDVSLTTGGHTGGISAAPAAYERTVVGFFDRTLLRDPPQPGAAEQNG